MAIADRKEREKEQRRAVILAAAEKLFFSRGYDQVSMEEIAREAELSKGTLFFYFTNKESLYGAIVHRGIRLFHEMVMDAMQAGGDEPVHRLSAMGKAVIRYARQYPGYLAAIRLYKSGRFPTGAGEDGEGAEIYRYATSLMETMEQVVRDGIEAGSIRNDIEPHELALMIRLMINSVMDMGPEFRWALDRYKIDEDAFVRRYLELVAGAVMAHGMHKKGCL